MNHRKSFPNDKAAVEQFLYGATVLAVRRRAKVLLIDLSTEYTLVVHLKMTGQLVFIKEGQPLRLILKSIQNHRSTP